MGLWPHMHINTPINMCICADINPQTRCSHMTNNSRHIYCYIMGFSFRSGNTTDVEHLSRRERPNFSHSFLYFKSKFPCVYFDAFFYASFFILIHPNCLFPYPCQDISGDLALLKFRTDLFALFVCTSLTNFY